MLVRGQALRDHVMSSWSDPVKDYTSWCSTRNLATTGLISLLQSPQCPFAIKIGSRMETCFVFLAAMRLAIMRDPLSYSNCRILWNLDYR